VIALIKDKAAWHIMHEHWEAVKDSVPVLTMTMLRALRDAEISEEHGEVQTTSLDGLLGLTFPKNSAPFTALRLFVLRGALRFVHPVVLL